MLGFERRGDVPAHVPDNAAEVEEHRAHAGRGDQSVPLLWATGPILRELFFLGLRRSDGHPAAASHALLVELTPHSALVEVAAEFGRGVWLIDLHPVDVGARSACGRRQACREHEESHPCTHCSALYRVLACVGNPPMDRTWSHGVWTALVELKDRLADILPGLAIMSMLVVLGLLLGFVVRALVTWLARLLRFDRHSERWGLAGALRRAGILRSPSETLGLVCFWAIF